MSATPLTQKGTLSPLIVIIQPCASRIRCTMAIRKKITPASLLNVTALIVRRLAFDFAVRGIATLLVAAPMIRPEPTAEYECLRGPLLCVRSDVGHFEGVVTPADIL